MFAVREAFNNGACVQRAIINEIFEQHHIVPDVASLIKQLYVKVALQAPEARIWKPVCVKACALAGMGDPDQNRCLARILLLSQKEKTELNIKLLLNNK